MPVDWKKTAEKYRGRLAFGGIDLSSVSDLTVWVLVFPDPNEWEKIDILSRIWCPEARLTDKKNKYRAQYQGWARENWIETTDGNAIDYDYVRHRIVEDAHIFNIESIALDRLFQGYEFATKLNDELYGSEKAPKVFTCGMGYLSMGPLCQELERRLLLGYVNHGGNPVLRWMADNTAVSTDPAGNRKPNKSESQGKIDGIIGILLGLDRQMRSDNKPMMLPVFF